ncbi:MAG: Sjogren's syndrome/scleroderma autoantigen 1 family protein [Methanospirillum sp.]
MTSDDEIMAEHLLHGARMLARACPDCGCPLFEVKGETNCVVCAARRASAEIAPASTGPSETTGAPVSVTPAPAISTPTAAGPLAEELGATLACLLQRARTEPDPERCRMLMECVRIGWGLRNS